MILLAAQMAEALPLAPLALNATVVLSLSSGEDDGVGQYRWQTSAEGRRLQDDDGSMSFADEHEQALFGAVAAPFILRILDFLYDKLDLRSWFRRWRQKEKGADSISPLHRAAHAADLSKVQQLLSEPKNRRAAVLNARMAHGATAFMLACEVGALEVAVALLEAGCDAHMTDDRGRTGVQLAILEGHAALAGFLAQDYAELSQQRPDPTDTFQDSFKIGFTRFVIWSTAPPFPDTASNWNFLAEGGFGKVYRCHDVWPPIEIAGERIRSVAIKAAKGVAAAGAPIDDASATRSVYGDRQEDVDFKQEIADLAQLNHGNIVRILGFTQSQLAPAATLQSWMLVMDYCATDLEKICGLRKHADAVYRTDELMLDLLTQTARGMEYIHGEGKTHWDLKPENVLVGNVGDESKPQWVARVADFGMAAAQKRPDWVGTYLFMPPEATQLNTDDGERFGPLGPAADVFSFGIMVWVVFAGEYRWFEGTRQITEKVAAGPGGVPQEDYKQVARWYYHGQRPGFEGRPISPKLQVLIEACWAAAQADRPSFSAVRRVMESCAAQLLAARPEPEPEVSYDQFLKQLGMEDKREALAELLEEGSELQELKQMTPDELREDVLDDGDLQLDADGKARLLEAVQNLSAADGGAQQSSAPQEEGEQQEVAARRVRADFASLLAEASAVPAAAGLVVPSWDEGGDAVLDSELNAAAAAPRGKAGGKAREGSLGATLLGDGDGGGGGDSGGLAAAAEPAATGSRPTEWGPRQVGEEFAALELPPVRCEWEGEAQEQYRTKVLREEDPTLLTRLGQRVWVADGFGEYDFWLEGTVAGHGEAGRPLVAVRPRLELSTSDAEPRCWAVVATDKPKKGRPRGGLTGEEAFCDGASWSFAVAANGGSQRSALVEGATKLIWWHLAQPVLYFVVFFSAEAAGELGGLQRLFGWGVAVREGLYVLSVLACVVVNPSFLLVDVAASVAAFYSYQGRLVENMENGLFFLGAYVLAPEKQVASALFEGGLGQTSLAEIVPVVILPLFDLCGLGALGATLGAPGPVPWALVVGYGVTTLAALCTTAFAIVIGIKEGNMRWVGGGVLALVVGLLMFLVPFGIAG